MLLDKGICSVFRRGTHAFTLLYQFWYGALSFETQSSKDNENTGVQNSARIRVLQNQEVIQGDLAVLRQTIALADTESYYIVDRAYHGQDDDNGQPITDLTLTQSLMTERMILIAGETFTDSMGTQTVKPSTTVRRTIAAEVQAISTEERYQAMAYGEKPEIRALIYADEYADEPFAALDGIVYRIQRRAKKGKWFELTCGEKIT
jgi:SPP1 family predicted phage head-tail adaptor